MKVLQIVMTVSIIATVIPRTVFGANVRSKKLRIENKAHHPDQSSSVISEDAPQSPNGNGCSSVPNNCDALCLKIDASGCIICACTGTEANISSSGLTSGSLTGSAIKLPHSAVMNLNGCPSFPAGCPGECASLDSNGCAICKCPVSGGSSGSTGGRDNSTSLSLVAVDNGYNHVHSGAMNNGNGCPPFSKDCQDECAAIDEHGCVVCQCTTSGGASGGSDNSTSVAGGGGGVVNAYNHASSGAMNNGNGCPTFSKDCPGECAAIDDRGCVVCRCTISGTPGANGTSSTGDGGGTTNTAYHNEYNHLPPGSSNNNNNCPQFSESCPAECTTSNDDGCPVCSCSVSGSTGGGSTSGGSGTDGQAVVCPPMDITCPADCMHIGNGGCILCQSDCKGPGTSSSGSSSGSITGNNNGCPIIDYNTCKPECASFDAKGCLLCTCTETHQGGATGSGNASGNNTGTSSGTSNGGSGILNGNHCPPFDQSCAQECTAIDSNGCILCTCAVTAPATTAHACPVFDTSCPPSCTTVDGKQCLVCTCSNIATATTIHTTTPAPTVPTTTTPPVTSACPVFDTSCPQACTSLDEMQCLTCTCADIATTTALYKTTTAPAVPTTTAAIITSACPVFDTSCPSSCISLDEMRCLTCTCADITTTPAPTVPTTTALPVTSACPVFDTSCPPACISLDEMQCLQCTCAALTSTTTMTKAATTTLPFGNENTCPPFDASCPSNCATIDVKGCLSCTCSGVTSIAPLFIHISSTTTKPLNQFGLGNGGCTPFDANCPAACTTTDAQGCLKCTCSGGTTAAPQPTTVLPTTAKPLSQVGLGNGCSPFDTNCAPACTTINVQGCMTCTCSATSSQSVSTTEIPPIMNPTTTSALSATCPPLRCVYPCDAGVTIGADRCPICKCHPVTTKSP